MPKTTQPKIDFSYATADLPIWKRSIIRTIEKFGGQRKLYAIYRTFLEKNQTKETFWSDVVSSLDLQIKTHHHPLASIPKQGPLLVVANHPFGLADGAAIAYLVSRQRLDFKVIAWDLFGHPPNMEHYLLPMDLSENSLQARRQNVHIRRQAIAELNNGHVVIIFPSGMAAMSKSMFAEPAEVSWGRFTAKLALATDAPVLPMFVHGHNSRFFHIASHLSYTLRLAMFFNEINQRIGSEVKVSMGSLIASSVLKSIADEQQIIDYLFAQTMNLQYDQDPAEDQHLWLNTMPEDHSFIAINK